MDLRYEKRGKVNISDFSRRAGFASRSFISEYLSGKKGLSRDALTKIKSALKLSRDHSRLFELLALQEQNPLPSFAAQISEARQKILEGKKPLGLKTAKPLMKKPVVFQIYAALGAIDKGSDVAEICAKTGLDSVVVLEGLRYLFELGVIDIREEHYFAKAQQADFLGLNEAEGLIDLLTQVSSQITKEAGVILADPDNAMFYTAFSVSKEKMATFKHELRELVFELIDRYQEEPGNSVQQVFFCSRGPYRRR